ncbi:MAG: carbohydrate ABC transporter permease [Anaerolineae bacterium]
MSVISRAQSRIGSLFRARTLEAREARLAYLLIVPTFLIVVGLVLFPAIFSIWISFHHVTLENLNDVFHAPFIGLKNYIKVAHDFAFPDALKTTIVYSFSATILTTIIGLIAALILNRAFPGRGLARAIFLFPYIAPVISVAYIWQWLLRPTASGVVNWALLNLNLISEPIAWLSTRGIALFMVILFEGWRYFPFAMLMLLARLQAIPQELYEAAAVDGAGTVRKFWHITLPELRYVMGTIFLLRLMWTFNKFDDIYLLTSGGFGTNVLPILTYQLSFGQYYFGRGAATAMILFITLAVFMFFYIRTVLEW